MKAKKYILINGIPCPESDTKIWSEWMQDREQRLVDYTELFDGAVSVSTVFMGLDMNFGEGKPMVFETTINGGIHNDKKWHYGTLGDAKQGHWHAVDLASGAEVK